MEEKAIVVQAVRPAFRLCTKPGNERRFEVGDMFGRLRQICYLPCDGSVGYLAEDAAFAQQARTVCELEYEAGFDIDRFFILARCGEHDFHRCPAFQVLEEILARRMLDGRAFDRHAVTVEVEEDPTDGNRHVTYIGNGDGRAGAIRFEAKDRYAAWLSQLEAACENCGRRGNDGGERGDDGDGAVEVKHGGIIAFFRRMFGGRKA